MAAHLSIVELEFSSPTASLLSFLQPEQHQEEAVEVILFGRNAGLICHQWDQIGLFLHGLFPTRPLTKGVKYF